MVEVPLPINVLMLSNVGAVPDRPSPVPLNPSVDPVAEAVKKLNELDFSEKAKFDDDGKTIPPTG